MLMFQNESSSKNISCETNLNWSFSKTTFVKKSHLNKDYHYFFIIFFLLRENKPGRWNTFSSKWFHARLVLKQRLKATW